MCTLSMDEDFLKRLLTFRSRDKVQRAFYKKGIDISLEDIDTLRNIVYDLEENIDKIAPDDLKIIEQAGNSEDIGRNEEGNGYFDQGLYNFFYNSRSKYPPDFFLNKSYYTASVISTGMFKVACSLFWVKEKYLKNRSIWEV